MLQRLIRYRASTPPAPGQTPAAKTAWLAEFERLHHAPEPDWPKHGIHLKSFSETGVRFDPGQDDSEEISFVEWNRRCIPEYLSELLQGRAPVKYTGGHEYEFSYGVEAVIGSEAWEAVKAAAASRRDQLYKKNIEHLLDDDALAKTAILIRLYAAGSLGWLRNPRRDILKFVCFALNEPPPERWLRMERDDTRLGTRVAACYLDRLDALPLTAVEQIFRELPKCLASRGRDVLHRLARADLAAASPEEVRTWFLEVVVDSTEDVCRGTTVDPHHFDAYLRSERPGGRLGHSVIGHPRRDGDDGGDPVDLARALLRTAQKRAGSGSALYQYEIWSEPIKVTPVKLVSDREAALGRRA